MVGNLISKWCQCWECAVCQFLSWRFFYLWFFFFLFAPRGYSL